MANAIQKMELLHSHEVVASVYELALETTEIQRWLLDRYLEAMKEKERDSKNNSHHAGAAGQRP